MELVARGAFAAVELVARGLVQRTFTAVELLSRMTSLSHPTVTGTRPSTPRHVPPELLPCVPCPSAPSGPGGPAVILQCCLLLPFKALSTAARNEASPPILLFPKPSVSPPVAGP